MSYLLRQAKHACHRILMRISAGDACEAPILIFGNQKTGTSAIASLLGLASDRTFCIDVFFRFRSLEVKLLKRKISFSEFYHCASGYMSNQIVKEPEFILFARDLKEYLPRSRMVVVARNPRDNIKSILSRLDIDSYSANSPACEVACRLPKNQPLWSLMFDRQLMPYDCTGSVLDVLINRWNFCADTTISVRESGALIVWYEDFISDKQSVIEALCTKLDLRCKKMSEQILSRQYQPPGTRSNATDFFSHDQLQQIDQRCEEKLRLLKAEVAVT